jgi:hypothetical protein
MLRRCSVSSGAGALTGLERQDRCGASVRVIVPLRAQQRRTACGYGVPMTVAPFAGIRVRDVTAARAWYERLPGEPSFCPNATEGRLDLGRRSVDVHRGGCLRAGCALIMVFVDDPDALISEIGLRGWGRPRARRTRTASARRRKAMTMETRSDSGARPRRTEPGPGRASSRLLCPSGSAAPVSHGGHRGR